MNTGGNQTGFQPNRFQLDCILCTAFIFRIRIRYTLVCCPVCLASVNEQQFGHKTGIVRGFLRKAFSIDKLCS
ncbi:hypothetical protein D3C72_1102760 [compost metagenome]